MEFDLSDMQYEYLFSFFDKVKEDLILAGVPSHFDFKLSSDGNSYTLRIKVLPNE